MRPNCVRCSTVTFHKSALARALQNDVAQNARRKHQRINMMMCMRTVPLGDLAALRILHRKFLHG